MNDAGFSFSTNDLPFSPNIGDVLTVGPDGKLRFFRKIRLQK